MLNFDFIYFLDMRYQILFNYNIINNAFKPPIRVSQLFQNFRDELAGHKI